MSATVVRCGCGNDAEPNDVLCGWCADHEWCYVPHGVTVGRSRLSGTPVAKCQCGWVCVYWACACELAHDCRA